MRIGSYLINILKKLLRKDQGSSLVEFSISTTLFVPVLLYSMYLQDVIPIKLKVQEAARYIAWEFTAFKQHDYGNSSNATMFNNARNAIKSEASTRYSNLNSAAPPSGSNKLFAVSYHRPTVNIDASAQAPIPSGTIGDVINSNISSQSTIFDINRIRSYVNTDMFTLLSGWGFNTNGVIKSGFSVNLQNILIPVNYLENSLYQGLAHIFPASLQQIQLQDNHMLITDDWSPRLGDTIFPTDINKEYYNQIRTVAFMGYNNSNGLSTIKQDRFTGRLQHMSTKIEEALTAKLTSINYLNRNAVSGQIDKSSYVDRGVKSFDTTPMQDGPNIFASEYFKTFNARGKYYMGCTAAQTSSCW